jgi:hypothetical protein
VGAHFGRPLGMVVSALGLLMVIAAQRRWNARVAGLSGGAGQPRVF